MKTPMTRGRVIRLSLLGLALIYFVLWPTIQAFRVRHRVAVALRGAASVRLEEFVFEHPLGEVELPRAEWPRVLSALPIIPDAGSPDIIAFCFVPHHRVVITDAQGQPFRLDVCFGCEQLAVTDVNIFGTPYFWRGPLRRLFTDHGIRLRTIEEYHAAWVDDSITSTQ